VFWIIVLVKSEKVKEETHILGIKHFENELKCLVVGQFIIEG